MYGSNIACLQISWLLVSRLSRHLFRCLVLVQQQGALLMQMTGCQFSAAFCQRLIAACSPTEVEWCLWVGRWVGLKSLQ